MTCVLNNIFCYKDKIYTFTKGGPTTSSLTDTLSNIYLCVWQQQIVEEIRLKKRIIWKVVVIDFEFLFVNLFILDIKIKSFSHGIQLMLNFVVFYNV